MYNFWGEVDMVNENIDLSFLEFSKAFPDNGSCGQHLAKQRWIRGFICPQCKHQQAWFLSKRNLYECKDCRHQTSITSGTIFHNTHVPLHKWYWFIYHMVAQNQDFSVSEIQHRLNIGSYKTAWLMAHKIRNAMVKRDKRFRLAGLIKLSMSFFSSDAIKQRQDLEHKDVVLCAIAIYQNYKGDQEPGFAHMEVVNHPSEEMLKDFLQKVDRGKKNKRR